jgi:hypothetical protein
MKLTQFELAVGQLLRDLDDISTDRQSISGHPAREHYQHTSECPPLTSFPEGVSQNWEDGYREHVSACPYCQKLVAAYWAVAPPNWEMIASYLIDSARFPDRSAMERYLELEHPVQLEILRRFLDSRGLLLIPKQVAQEVLKSIIGLFITFPKRHPDLSQAALPNEFSSCVVFPALDISVRIFRDTEGTLQAHLALPRERYAAEEFWVSICGTGQPIIGEFRISPSVATVAFTIGTATQLVIEQGNECFIAVGLGALPK